MATPSAQTPAARKAAADRQAALDALAGIACRHAKGQLMNMVHRMVAAMLDMTGAGPDPRLAARRIKSGNLLRENAYAYFHLACSGIELALRKELSTLNPQPAAPAPVALSLVPLEEIDQKLAFSAVSRPFDIQFSEQLACLGVRLGVLLGRDLVRAAGNPFRPEVFLVALEEAWREFEPDAEAHGLVAPLLRPGLVFDLGPMYEALNEKLKPARARGADRFAKTDDSAARKAERARREASMSQQLRRLFGAEAAAPEPGELDIPLIPDLPQGAGGWRPSAAG
ncbi:DUF1631 family protein, partial [Massilia sp. DD77]|uniref:DUF1631 family protein n=1 Tax=Massilia sp. DD77 TaxID=3109349 RepID=UPI00300070A3